MERNRRTVGTTLVEVLVVIVVFLVGILAVIQIFPKGFQLLLLTRNKSIAQSLARETVEGLAAEADQLPEQIVGAHYVNGYLVIDASKDPSDLGPIGTNLRQDGTIYDPNGNLLGEWPYFSGGNSFRRIIGEGRRVPPPGVVGTGTPYFGGLMVLKFGPIYYQPETVNGPSNLAVYGNDLEQFHGTPATTDTRTDYQFYVSSNSAGATVLQLPSGPLARKYRVSFSAYVSNTGGGVTKRDYSEIPLLPINATVTDSSGQYPLVSVQLTGVGGWVTDPIQYVDFNTLRVQRSYTKIDKGADFDAADPYEYKLLNENLGVLLFNPVAHEVYVSRNGHEREPLQAKVNYDVYDWRILHDDFRIDVGVVPGEPSVVNPQLLSCQHRLPVGGLKTAGNAGPDGRPNTPIRTLEVTTTDGSTDTSSANGPGSDNFVLVDLQTGGIFCENNPLFPTQKLIHVDKSSGVVTIEDMDGISNNGITGALLLPDGSIQSVQMDNRAVRALYMTRQEFTVQVLKAASQYSISTSAVNLSPGQFYVGASMFTGVAGPGQPWRIYFPQSDNGRKVTIGQVTYLSSKDNAVHTLYGQDFLIKFRNDSLSLPSIDLTDADGSATTIDFSNGIGAKDVKGATVAVRVLWNPDAFNLSTDPNVNMSKLEQWGRGWRRSTNETFIQRGENIR